MMSRRTMSLPASLVALVALAGCGAENTLSSLDQTLDSAPPSAPTNIRQETRGAISVLAWDESTDADVVGYDVYVYSPDPARESAYVRINAATIEGDEFVVSTSGTLNAWYRVKAVDQSGNRSASSGAAYVEGETSIAGGLPNTDELPVARP
jgi:hypothetical protein